MIHYERLERLPLTLEFPKDLRGRIWYEADRHQLAYDGFMSKAVFDRLEQLHDDREYRLALENLFRVATPETCAVSQAHQPRRVWIAAGAVVAMAIAIGVLWLAW